MKETQERQSIPMTILLTPSQKTTLRLKAFQEQKTMSQLLRDVVVSTLNLK